MAFYHVGKCDCPMGCCDCGPVDKRSYEQVRNDEINKALKDVKWNSDRLIETVTALKKENVAYKLDSDKKYYAIIQQAKSDAALIIAEAKKEAAEIIKDAKKIKIAKTKIKKALQQSKITKAKLAWVLSIWSETDTEEFAKVLKEEL